MIFTKNIKFLSFSILIIAIINYIFIGSFESFNAATLENESCISGSCSAVKNAYGYKISLVLYDKPSNTYRTLGRPILLANPKMFETVTLHRGNTNPTSQIVTEDMRSVYTDKENKPSPISGWEYNSDDQASQDFIIQNADRYNTITTTTFPNKFYYETDYQGNYEFQIGAMAGNVNRFGNLNLSVCGESERFEGHAGYARYILKFNTTDRRITYSKDTITNLGDFYVYSPNGGVTGDRNVGEDFSYVDNLISNVFFKDRAATMSYTGIDLYNYQKDSDKLYVIVEPVQRVFDGIKKEGSSYIAKTDEKIIRREAFWNVGDWSKHSNICRQTDPYKCNCKNKCTQYKTIDGEKECVKQKRECDTCYKHTYYEYGISPMVGLKHILYYYGKNATGNSHIQTSRSLNSGSYYLKRAANLCTSKENAHCILEKDGVTCQRDSSGNIKYQYYIGPDLERAWVTPSGTGISELKGMSGNRCTGNVPENSFSGIKHYFLITIQDKCNDICSLSMGSTTDQFLKCVENYCDARENNELEGNPVKRKRQCILNCGYKYETTGCNKNPYQGSAKLPLSTTSTCNTLGGYKMQDVEGTLVTCEGDVLTGDDDKDTIFDQRKYINVACKETTSFEYKDVNRETVFAGKGIDYFVNQKGVKECTYYFNTTQWKFDYASIPSKDLLRRQRLKYIYTAFNNAYNKSYDQRTNAYHYPTHNPYPSQPVDSELDFANEHYGEIEVQTYDLDKTLVTSGVTEIVENKIKPSGSQPLVRKDEKRSTTLSNAGTDTLVLIANYSYNTASVSKYVSTSTAPASYKYKKACIKTDGTSEVYYPGESVDTCHTIRQGANYKDVLAKNVYYTNLKATPNEDFKNSSFAHYFQTTATVDAYYRNDEKCEYKIGDSAVGCVVDLLPESGTEKLGYNVFKGGNVKAKVIITKNDLPKDDDIASISIKVNNVNKGNVEEIIIGKTKAYEAKEDFKVEATITTEKDIEYTALCENRFSLLKDGDGCTCVKKDDKLYEIIPNTTPQEVSASTLINMKPQKVNKSLFDSRYYVALEEPLEYGNTIIGYVKTGSGTASCSCPTTDVLKSCTDEFKPAELGSITEYCYANYDKDINNYSSAVDCISRCSNNCPNDQRNEAVIDKFCTDNAINLGYDSVNECKNNCYNPYAEDGYLFRSIHNYDPFPYSPNSPYVQGNRGIGKNWYAKEEYIKDDDNDETSVTGDYANLQVEYIMDLEIDDIRNIRKQNDKDGKDAYIKLTYASRASDENYVGEYKSKFLHDTLKGKNSIFIQAINEKSARYLPEDTKKQK